MPECEIRHVCAECHGQGFILSIGDREVECWDCHGWPDWGSGVWANASCSVELPDGPNALVVLMRPARRKAPADA